MYGPSHTPIHRTGDGQGFQSAVAGSDSVLALRTVARGCRGPAWGVLICLLLALCPSPTRALQRQDSRAPESPPKHLSSTSALAAKSPELSKKVRPQAARALVRGTIRDRNGIPLAIMPERLTGQDRQLLKPLLAANQPLCQEGAARCYPLEQAAFHLLGDLRVTRHWAPTRSRFMERELSARLASPTADVFLSIDARLQRAAYGVLEQRLKYRWAKKAAVVILDVRTGEILAQATHPAPPALAEGLDEVPPRDDTWYDRSRGVLYPPGSTFKMITAMAALRQDRALRDIPLRCSRLEDKRVGCLLPDDDRPIRDDQKEKRPHHDVTLFRAISISCNAYFAQLAWYHLKPEVLLETAALFGISLGRPNTAEQITPTLPQTAFGQSEVLLTPLQLASVAATIANDGVRVDPSLYAWYDPGWSMPEPVRVVSEEQARFLQDALRSAVTDGTAKTLRKGGEKVLLAGKTGTAEVRGPSHAWFAGFAPYRPDPVAPKRRTLAFAVLVENAGYGAENAAPIARQLMEEAERLHLFDLPSSTQEETGLATPSPNQGDIKEN